MRDPARIDRMIDKLRKYWKCYPDLRLGQIIENMKPAYADTFNVEDDVIERTLSESTKRNIP